MASSFSALLQYLTDSYRLAAQVWQASYHHHFYCVPLQQCACCTMHGELQLEQFHAYVGVAAPLAKSVKNKLIR